MKLNFPNTPRSYENIVAKLMDENLRYPAALERQMLPAFPPIMELWRSRDFLVQVYAEERGAVRLSVCRTAVTRDGKWVDGITWDELQRVKREMGHADKCAIEIYPADADMVNVANMRHLWLVNDPPPFAWRKT